MCTKWIVGPTLCCALFVAGCAAPPNQEQTGMVIGGAMGGALGSQIGGGSGQTVATVAGTLLGAAVGSAVGRSMDEQDQLQVAHALENTRTGVPSQWTNPDTGNQYSVVPTHTYDNAGTPCREFVVDGLVGGKKQKIFSTACRQADGSWRIVNQG